MISNLDANLACGLIDITHHLPLANKHLFSFMTGTILTMKRGERAVDDGDGMSDDERGKFMRRETGRFSLSHYENCDGEAKSDIVKDVARGA
jgi:hypothetical protein